MAKYIFVTGGVVSSLGKGIAAASIGCLLESRGLKFGKPLAVRYGRVKLAEHIAQCTGARLTILLIGERPGGDALASRSLSAPATRTASQPRPLAR